MPSTEPLDSDKWQDTGVVDNALLVNIGDALELWSGAIFKSTLHRVVLPTPLPAEGIPERYSMAWFNQPKPSASLKTVVPTSQITERKFRLPCPLFSCRVADRRVRSQTTSLGWRGRASKLVSRSQRMSTSWLASPAPTSRSFRRRARRCLSIGAERGE